MDVVENMKEAARTVEVIGDPRIHIHMGITHQGVDVSGTLKPESGGTMHRNAVVSFGQLKAEGLESNPLKDAVDHVVEQLKAAGAPK